MTVLKPDERRRITLPRDIADLDEEFVAIKVKEGILLKSIPKDPIAALQKEGQKLKGVSRKELRKMAHEHASKGANK